MGRYVEIFDHLASLKSRKERINVLQTVLRYDEFVKVVNYALNPFITFGITSYDMEEPSSYAGDIDLFEFLEKLRTREITGNRARLMAGEIAKKSDDAERLLKIILGKSLDCGVGVKTINSVIPNLIPEFELCAAEIYDPDRGTWPRYYCEKIDGIRCATIFRTPKDIQFLSRNGKPLHNALYLKEYVQRVYKRIKIPFVLDGEIDYGSLEETKSQLGRKEFSGEEGIYKIFDFIPYETFITKNKSKPFIDRYDFLKYALSPIIDEYSIDLVEHFEALNDAEVQEAYKFFIERDGEGLMTKDPLSRYVFGRTPFWQKLKLYDTLDLTVLRAEEGSDRLKGKLGALIVDFNGQEVNVGTGFSDEQRDLYFKQMPEVIEVSFHRVTKAGSLRDPRFKSVREDKT